MRCWPSELMNPRMFGLLHTHGGERSGAVFTNELGCGSAHLAVPVSRQGQTLKASISVEILDEGFVGVMVRGKLGQIIF